MIVGIYGASGFGREVLPYARRFLPEDTAYCFIDDNISVAEANGFEVMDFDRFCALDGEKSVSVAIADAKIRQVLETKVREAGIAIQSITDPSAFMGDSVEIGEGAIICPMSQITSNVVIGKSFHLNLASYVAHDCVVGDYVTFAPGVHCNGNVRIEDHAYIGTGAILRQGTPDKPLVIGREAVVGMGAVVTKNIPAGETWIGNPARPMVR